MPMVNPRPPRRRLRLPIPYPLVSVFSAPAQDYVQNLLLALGVEAVVHDPYRNCHGGPLVEALARRVDPALPTKDAPAARLARACRRFLSQNPDPVEPRAPAEPAAANLKLLGDLLNLDDGERRLACLAATMVEDVQFHRFIQKVASFGSGECTSIAAAAMNVSESVARLALSPRSKLVASGILDVRPGADSLESRMTLEQGLAEVLMTPGLTRAELVEHLLPEAKPTDLGVEDFAHLRSEVATARTLLGEAVRQQSRGVNVLFVGATGTGKTALAALIARDLGLALHSAGTRDDDGDPARPSQRISSMLLGQRLFTGGAALLLFDELEDLFGAASLGFMQLPSGRQAVMSKLWFNLLLEENPVPTIWAANSVEGVDPSFLRRFAYVVSFDAAGPGQRARALQRHLGPADASAEEVEQLARRYRASPAQLATAARAARLISADGNASGASLDRLLAPMERLLHGPRPPMQRFDPATFRLDGVRADAELGAVASQLAGWKESDRPGASLCLYGPPGTGKTEFASFLADQCGRPVVSHRGSDLLSMWVGGTEKAIAAAFREADAEGAVLVLDEVDSFLRK